MPESIVRCPGCEAKLRMAADQPAVRCPKCGTVIRAEELPPPAELGPALEPAKADRLKTPAEEWEERQKRKRQQRSEKGEDLDDREVKALLKRGAGPQDEPDEGPWRTAGAVGAAVSVMSFLATWASFGSAGFPDLGDKGLLILGFFCFVAGVTVGFGVVHVKAQYIQGKWGNRTTGGAAVAVGFAEVFLGSLALGFLGYGLVSMYIKWATT